MPKDLKILEGREKWQFPMRGLECILSLRPKRTTHVAASIARLIQQQQQQLLLLLRLLNTSVLCTISLPPRGTGELALEVIEPSNERPACESAADVRLASISGHTSCCSHAGGLARTSAHAYRVPAACRKTIRKMDRFMPRRKTNERSCWLCGGRSPRDRFSVALLVFSPPTRLPSKGGGAEMRKIGSRADLRKTAVWNVRR
jgi:hypothetical protein